ncbi:MAG: sigma-70 family RNA polymerase sigma factor [Chloroflexi bacterium]|nr:sigma-70 family RNA polymerase sigma factor [Chloroflexota bacterium]
MEQPDREQEWIRNAQRGDVAAYEALVRAYETLAFRAAYLLTRDAQEAAGAAQDAFVRAYRALHTFRLGEPFRPWLMRIVTNQALNRIQAAQRRAKMNERFIRLEIENRESRTAQEHLELREQNEKLIRAVRRLKPDEQALISLRYFLELPEIEVAHALQIPQGTVKSRLHRTLAKLREIIRNEFPDLAELTL